MAEIFIKASEISNLTDARYFSAQGVEWLGFNLDENNPEAVSHPQFLAIREWISGPNIVGEFATLSDISYLNRCIDSLKLKAVQIGQFIQVDSLKKLPSDITLFYEQIIENKEDVLTLKNNWEELRSFVHFFILDFSKNNISWSTLISTPEIFNAIQSLAKDFPLLLSFNPENNEFSEIFTLENLLGLSLKGGSELKTGMKSFETYDSIFEYLEEIKN
jgi:phosphoribosylanthranilate isomerase